MFVRNRCGGRSNRIFFVGGSCCYGEDEANKDVALNHDHHRTILVSLFPEPAGPGDVPAGVAGDRPVGNGQRD